jgi:hypothetical protein
MELKIVGLAADRPTSLTLSSDKSNIWISRLA